LELYFFFSFLAADGGMAILVFWSDLVFGVATFAAKVNTLRTPCGQKKQV